jgi:hypothetical protein
MAPATQLTSRNLGIHAEPASVGESAWETHASWRRVKSAPQHRDFVAGEAGVN